MFKLGELFHFFLYQTAQCMIDGVYNYCLVCECVLSCNFRCIGRVSDQIKVGIVKPALSFEFLK